MIPFTKDQFRTILALFLLVFFAAVSVFMPMLMQELKDRAPTELDKSERTVARERAANVRRAINDDGLWDSSEPEAKLIASTVITGSSVDIYVLYRAEDGEEIEGLAIAKDFNDVRNEVRRDIVEAEMLRYLTDSTVPKFLRKNGKKAEVIGLILYWEDEDGKYAAIDADGNGAWDHIAKGGKPRFADSGDTAIITNSYRVLLDLDGAEIQSLEEESSSLSIKKIKKVWDLSHPKTQ